MKRKIPFINRELYHVYNRGVDKRDIFSDKYDLLRFFQSMDKFNSVEPIGSIYENTFKNLGGSAPKLKLVNFICYCLNLNHYHFILEQISDKGIEKFMQRIGTGYTNYFNEKNKRSGSLFQGKFKSSHIDSNEYLLHLSAYVNLNNRVHQLGSSTPKLVYSKSSWDEYMSNHMSKSSPFLCKKDIILGQFTTINEYKIFAEETLSGIVERRKDDKKLESLLLE